MTALSEIVACLQQLAPLHLAAEWDNVGLLLGDPAASAARVMTCLTLTPESAAEAVAQQAGLVVTHHPILFRPTQRLAATNPEGRMLWALARAGVAVYSAHTAWDNAPGGINDYLAERLGLTQCSPLAPGVDDAPAAQRKCKIAVFVPDSDLGRVMDAMFSAGAGVIGQYSECSYRLSGTGTFFGSDAANPTIGRKGLREEVSEWRLEVLCPEARLAAVVGAMRKAHSYEEPAFDIYPLRCEPGKNGVGRIGTLPQATPLAEFAQMVKRQLSASCVQTVGDPKRAVQRVAIVCGSGGEFVQDAVVQKADVLLTGEARFHDCLAAQANGLALILPGHYASERGGVEELARRLQERFPKLEVWPSKSENDPVLLP